MMDEYISREAAVKAVAKHAQEMRETKGVGLVTMQLYQLGFKHAIDVLDTLPTADVTPVVRGEWKDHYDRMFPNQHAYYCSNCGSPADYFVWGSEDWWCGNKPNFCPNCGADMRKEANDD